MKKLTLFAIALLASVVSFAAQPKRIYAHGLSVTLAENVYTFSFNANETPTAGKLVFYDATSAEKVGEVTLENLVEGKNEVAVAAYSLPGEDGQQLNWSVELSAAAVTAYEKVFADASHRYRRGYSNVDVNPESDYFGNVYVADRTSTKSLSKFYVYSPDYKNADANGYTLGASDWAFGRFAIAPDGKVWLSDYSDGHSGLFIVDPADLTKTTQFFAGTRASSGLIKNGNVEVGSSLSCATLYGKGANTKLVTVAEDYTGTSFPVAVFNVGQEDGSLASSWTTAPNIIFNTLGNAAQIFEAKACEKGIWVATNRGTGANNSGATSLRFYTWDGTCTWSSHEHIDIINGNLGGGIAITPDEKQIVMKIHDNNIAVFDITWNEDTPTLTTNATFNCGYAAVSAINLDYAGNIVTVAGTNFGSTDTQRMSLVVYSNPTNDNTCEVPAKKSSVVTKVAASATLYTVVTNVNDVVMGVVTGNAGTYEEGATATLTAEPTTGYQFVNWTVGEDTYTANPLEIVVNSNLTITANFKAISYTITANVNKEQYGNVTGGGAYDYNTTATLTATANDGYEFVNWSNGSTDNPLAYTVTKDETITANFRQVLASSITLNALPVQDYSATIVGTLKRALQNGENTIVLTHEANGTPHIYNVAHATNTVTEISQEGVVAVDSENAGDYLAISDIALTEDGKLVATNKIVCQSEDGQVAAGYKRGELRAYIWNDLAGAPSLWFTSKQSSNWYRSIQGHTIAYKGTSTNGTLFATGVTASGVKFRYSVYNVIDGVYTDPSSNNSDYYHFTKGSAQTTDALGANYQLVASPLASPNWILDGELVEPFEIVDPLTFNTEVTANPTLSVNLGKKYNGASCLANYNEHHLFLAPYANEEGYLAGVKVVDVVDGFAAATELTTNTDLATAENATAAAATAVVDAEGKLTIHLFADARVYTFTEKAVDPTPPEVELVGVVKRALTIGESTVVLTHEADGTPHIYNIVGEEIAEVSQVGVIARDPENAGDLLAISDIAATEDGKLVAVNYMICQSEDAYVDDGYKRGESRFYIWNTLTEDPSIWFTSNKYSNWFRAKQGYSIALRGTSQNAEILLTGLHATKYWARYTCYKVVDGAYTEDYWFEGTLAGTLDENKCGSAYELNASPLSAANWIMDGELVDPIEYLDAEANAGKIDFYPELVSLSIDLGKKFNGVTYLTIGTQAIMVAPYADAEGKLAGVKVLDITAGLDKATELKVANLDAAVEATAAATAVAVADNVLTITLVADATLHLLEVELEKGPTTALDNIAVEAKAIKMIKNGQLIIIKNGIQYNVQGAVVK